MYCWRNVLLLFGLSARYVLAGVDDWHFLWPDETSQCEEVTITVTGGVPPWALQIVPIGGQPLYWQFTAPPNPVNASWPATVTIPLQLAAGTPYVTIMSDSEGFNEALNNPTNIQVVKPSSDSSCLAAANPAKKDFDFQVYGGASQCERSFGVTWTTSVGRAPYWCTIVPLDTSYNPWTVQLTEEGSVDDSAVWRVNMTSGTRFTVIMHDGYGEGRGGVGQIYEVATTDNRSCVTQSYNGRADWPAGLQINGIPTTTTAWASQPSQTGSVIKDDVQTASTSPSASASPISTGGSSLSTGAIAGIAAGGAVLALVAALLLIWYLRRKRSRRSHGIEPNVDLLGGGGGGMGAVEPKVEPYRPINESNAVPSMGYGARAENGYETGQLVHLDDHFARSEVTTPYTPGSAIPLLGGMMTPSERPTSSYTNTTKGGYYIGAPGSEGASSTSPRSPGSNSQGYFPPIQAGQPSSSQTASPPDVKVAVSPPIHPLPPLPAGAMGAMGGAPQAVSQSRSASPEFRRHTDGGEVAREEREVVDLPPLYSDVPSRL